MAEKEVKDIDSLIDQGLNTDNSELDLREKELDDEDLIKVLESDKVKGVTALFLEFNDIGDEGLKALVASDKTKFLTALNLFKNKVTDDGLKALAEAKTILNLS